MHINARNDTTNVEIRTLAVKPIGCLPKVASLDMVDLWMIPKRAGVPFR
jgi:hypothetical protein